MPLDRYARHVLEMLAGRAHPGMIHDFYCLPRMIPYALEAMRIIGSEIGYAVKLPQLERLVHRRIRPELIRA